MQRANVAQKTQAFIYDFSVDGGAVGIYNTPLRIPAGVVIEPVSVQVLTTYTGGGSTINVGYGGNNILFNAMSPQAAGFVGLTGTLLTLSTGAVITLRIVGAPVTAGKLKFVFPYYESF